MIEMVRKVEMIEKEKPIKSAVKKDSKRHKSLSKISSLKKEKYKVREIKIQKEKDSEKDGQQRKTENHKEKTKERLKFPASILLKAFLLPCTLSKKNRSPPHYSYRFIALILHLITYSFRVHIFIL